MSRSRLLELLELSIGLSVARVIGVIRAIRVIVVIRNWVSGLLVIRERRVHAISVD